MRDCGEMVSVLLFDPSEKTQWSNELAQIHQSTVGKKQTLLDAGLRCLSFDVLETEFDMCSPTQSGCRLRAIKVVMQLKRYSEEIRRDCQSVEGLILPSTLVYGDLFFSNIYRSYGREACHGIIDFAEAACSHSFADALGCPDRLVYSEKWISFLEIKLPHVAQEISLDKIRESLFVPKAVPVVGGSETVQRDESGRMLSATRNAWRLSWGIESFVTELRTAAPTRPTNATPE